MVLHGQVQGVGLRYRCHWKAEDLGLCGWVCNSEDGTVQIHLEGLSYKVSEFQDWLRSGGVPDAQISRLETFPTRTEELTTFEIR